MVDLKIYETGNGGDLELNNNDLTLVTGLESMLYLAMFGGNVEGDWWGNELLMPNQPDIHLKSETEKVLMSVALNSAGRIKIEQAVKNDLAFIQKAFPGTKLVVSVTIVSDDIVSIVINVDGKDFNYLWNPAEEQAVGVVLPDFLSPEDAPGYFLLTEDGLDYLIPES